VPTTQTVVVGGGQAGLALSHWLGRLGHEHVVLERGRVGQAWRDRWPSLRLLTPASENHLPGAPPPRDLDGFASRDELVHHLSEYAAALPVRVREGIHVDSARRRAGGSFEVRTAMGTWRAPTLVVATGHSAMPVVPRLSTQVPTRLRQLTAAQAFRDLASIERDVLVVGAGATGQQLAADLARRGCHVTIAVGRHRRLPRRYRGADIWTWLRLVGELDRTIDETVDPDSARRAPSAALSGSDGGQRLDLGVLASLGVRVRGRLVDFTRDSAHFDGSLPQSVRSAEDQLRATLRQIDEYAARHRLDAPGDEPAEQLQLVDAGPVQRLGHRGTVVWAAGYRPSNPWLQVPAPVRDGALVQRRGVTPVPGLYVLGQRFQHLRGSHFLGGVGQDARYVAAHLVSSLRGLPEPCHTPGHAASLR
jgi:putative flavoprotein involved in K+ transport